MKKCRSEPALKFMYCLKYNKVTHAFYFPSQLLAIPGEVHEQAESRTVLYSLDGVQCDREQAGGSGEHGKLSITIPTFTF